MRSHRIYPHRACSDFASPGGLLHPDIRVHAYALAGPIMMSHFSTAEHDEDTVLAQRRLSVKHPLG